MLTSIRSANLSAHYALLILFTHKQLVFKIYKDETGQEGVLIPTLITSLKRSNVNPLAIRGSVRRIKIPKLSESLLAATHNKR